MVKLQYSNVLLNKQLKIWLCNVLQAFSNFTGREFTSSEFGSVCNKKYPDPNARACLNTSAAVLKKKVLVFLFLLDFFAVIALSRFFCGLFGSLGLGMDRDFFA